MNRFFLLELLKLNFCVPFGSSKKKLKIGFSNRKEEVNQESQLLSIRILIWFDLSKENKMYRNIREREKFFKRK